MSVEARHVTAADGKEAAGSDENMQRIEELATTLKTMESQRSKAHDNKQTVGSHNTFALVVAALAILLTSLVPSVLILRQLDQQQNITLTIFQQQETTETLLEGQKVVLGTILSETACVGRPWMNAALEVDCEVISCDCCVDRITGKRCW